MKNYVILTNNSPFEYEVECEDARDLVKKCAEYEGNHDEWLDDILASNAFSDDKKLFDFYWHRYSSDISVIYEITGVFFRR